ncbi:MAG: hypothetical protein ACRCZ9_11630 [Fusobacteriaceae bacterium]
MKKVYNLLFLYFLIFSTTLSFHITPTFFAKRIDTGGYQEYILKNNTNSTIRYQVSVLPGLGTFPNMNEWIEFSPKVLTIKPQSNGILKIYSKAPNGTSEGQYSAVINLKTVNIPKLKTDTGDAVAAAARLGINVSLEINGYVGELDSDLEVSNLKIVENEEKKAVITFNVKNKTPKRGVYYTIDVLDKNGIYSSFEKGRIELDGTNDIKLTLTKAGKKDIVGIVLKETSTQKTITQKKL